MGQRIKNFIFYNNGFTLLILLVLLGGGSALAADPDVREGVISSEEKIIQVDNSYIRDVNLGNHDFKVKIISVEKDDDNYYLTYEFRTIELVDGAWKKITKEDVLIVNIEQLGERDLGLYAAEQLRQLVESTKRFLTEVQEDEKKKGRTDKTVAKTYKGLVGRYLKPEEVTFEGYNPVIEPPVVVRQDRIVIPETVEPVPVNEVVEEEIGEDSANQDQEPAPVEPTASSTDTTASSSGPVVIPDTTAPVIVLNGAAVMELSVGAEYSEPGATASDDLNGDLTEYIVISGVVNTSAAGDYTIVYGVADAAGNTASIERQVKVTEPAPEPEILINEEAPADNATST